MWGRGGAGGGRGAVPLDYRLWPKRGDRNYQFMLYIYPYATFCIMTD